MLTKKKKRKKKKKSPWNSLSYRKTENENWYCMMKWMVTILPFGGKVLLYPESRHVRSSDVLLLH